MSLEWVKVEGGLLRIWVVLGQTYHEQWCKAHRHCLKSGKLSHIFMFKSYQWLLSCEKLALLSLQSQCHLSGKWKSCFNKAHLSFILSDTSWWQWLKYQFLYEAYKEYVQSTMLRGHVNIYTNMHFPCSWRICKLKVRADITQYCNKGYKIKYDRIEILFQCYGSLEED